MEEKARSRTCHICRRSCLINGYIGHINQCKRKFLSEQALLPLHERRRLPPDPLFKVDQPTKAELDILKDYSKLTGECVNCGKSFDHERLVIHQRQCTKEKASTSATISRPRSSRPISAPPVRVTSPIQQETVEEDLSKTAPLDLSRPNSFARLVSLKDSFRANVGRKLLGGRNSVTPLLVQDDRFTEVPAEDATRKHDIGKEVSETVSDKLKERSARIDAVNAGVQVTVEGLASLNTSLSRVKSDEKSEKEGAVRESVSSLTDLRMKLNSRGGSRGGPADTLRRLEARTAYIETALLALLEEVREVRTIIATDLTDSVAASPHSRYREATSPSTPSRNRTTIHG